MKSRENVRLSVWAWRGPDWPSTRIGRVREPARTNRSQRKPTNIQTSENERVSESLMLPPSNRYLYLEQWCPLQGSSAGVSMRGVLGRMLRSLRYTPSTHLRIRSYQTLCSYASLSCPRLLLLFPYYIYSYQNSACVTPTSRLLIHVDGYWRLCNNSF
jgi:hypothetical protein